MDLLHWLGFCPCKHGHLDIQDVIPAFAGLTAFFSFLSYKIRSFFKRDKVCRHHATTQRFANARDGS